MKHEYLSEFEDGVYPFNEKDCPDFDPRDTYSLKTTFVAWLYERLRYFQDEASKVVDFSYYTFDIGGETLTQRQCIDRMVEDCKIILETDTILMDDEFDRIDAIKDDLFDIFKKVFWAMWW